ncbi:MAG: hypothetical protein HY654_13940, partial [Acidobacteria bacterium]|nr:hypothetical protein [Acidobacteriota bacterium]
MKRAFIPNGLAVVATTLLVVSLGRSQEQGLRGFPRQQVAAQQQLEERFRAIPRPENLREYMRVITEEPHAAGTPGSRKVAEYILAQFQSWG